MNKDDESMADWIVFIVFNLVFLAWCIPAVAWSLRCQVRWRVLLLFAMSSSLHVPTFVIVMRMTGFHQMGVRILPRVWDAYMLYILIPVPAFVCMACAMPHEGKRWFAWMETWPLIQPPIGKLPRVWWLCGLVFHGLIIAGGISMLEAFLD